MNSNPVSRFPAKEKERPHASKLRTAAIAAGGAGLAYGGLRIGRAAQAVEKLVKATTPGLTRAATHTGTAAQRVAGAAGHLSRAAAHGVKTAENAAAISGGIRRPFSTLLDKAIRWKLGSKALSARRRVIAFAAQKKELDPAIATGVSSGLGASVLGGLHSALKNGSTLRGSLKAAGKLGGITAALTGGSVLVGDKLLGDPKPNDSSAYTKRALVGGALVGPAAGALGGVLLAKTGVGRKLLAKHLGDYRLKGWLENHGTATAAAVGAVAGGAVIPVHAADEASGVDTLRNLRGKKAFSAPLNSQLSTLNCFDEPQLKGRLASDRYKKKIQDDDLDRRDANTGRAAAAGILAGALARSGKLSPLKRSALGAGAGIGGVLAVRQATTGSRDLYGERSRGAKQAERLPQIAGLTAAGVLAAKRFKLFSAQRRTIAFGGYQQVRTERGRFEDPLDPNIAAPVIHGQAIRSAINKGRDFQRIGRRAANLTRDVTDSVRGIPKVDARGRPQRREWEKPWARNLAGSTAAAGGLLLHTRLLRTNPNYRAQVGNLVKRGKTTANRFVPDLFPMAAKVRGVIRFDQWADQAGWDLRDPRGKSARVFAPGSVARQRREKYWHEKVDNQRRLLTAAGVVGTVGGALLSHRLTKSSLLKSAAKAPLPGNIIASPMAKRRL